MATISQPQFTGVTRRSVLPSRELFTPADLGALDVRAADAALAASEERFRLLAERSQDVVYRVSTADRRLEYISPAATTLTGYTPAEFYADPDLWTRLVHPDDRALVERRPREPAEIAAPAVLRWIARDGSTVWTEHRSVPVFDAEGSLVAVEGVARDVTRSVEAEGLLRESEARFREFLSKIEIGALMLDASARIVFINDHLLQILERPRDEMLGSDWFAILPDRERPDVQEVFGRAFESGNLSGSREHGILTGSGEERRLLWTSVLQKDVDGHVVGVASVAHDVTELHRAEDELILEARVRALLSEAIQAAERTSSLEEAATSVCDGLASLPGIHVVDLVGFLGSGDAVVVAHSGPDGLPGPGDQLSEARARHLQERATAGAWGERPESDPQEGEISEEMRAVGVQALAFGPIRHGDDVMGVLVVGTRDSRFAAVVADKMPSLVSFGASSNTVLVERLEARRREYRLRGTFDALLATRAFHPVFQPIVELESGETIGYEGLTRFDSGERPDVCFADAWSVGMGAELELATLEAAIAAARSLPAGRWLDLNISPRLLQTPERLTPLLAAADRPLVVEITEHELIEDYAAVREAAAALGSDVRLAVDDAGVGIANFGHIIELRPDFVKIDISLVRRVNADPGRQALVVAMRHFARTAGCRLVAEGVESDEERRTLRMLGVEFGQGHWFGRPEPVEHWAEGSKAA